MAYIIGAALGSVWLWFWLRGNWFAAVIAFIALGWYPFIIDYSWIVAWRVVATCFLLPWVPVASYAVANFIKKRDASMSRRLTLHQG